MNGQLITVKPNSSILLSMLVLLFASATALAQVPVDEDGKPIPAYYEDQDDIDNVQQPASAILSAAELEELVGPVALYPDDLLAIVLPAATYPLEIVQAARFLERLQSDSALKPDEDWDESVVALLNYPDVIRMMDEDIDWTWRLGDAVLSQQTEVIAAVESFRDRAYAAGNLKTDEYQTVKNEGGVIEIAPVNEEIIYVPYYEPAEVVVYQPRRVYYYHPDPYPVYYYPYPVGYRFHSPYFWGVTTAFHIGWDHHYLHVYHPSYFGHPYYGYTYYDHYYRRPSINVYNSWYGHNNYNSSRNHYRDGDYWRPRHRAGSRQDEPRVRNYHYPPNDGGANDSRSTTSRITRSNNDRNRTDSNRGSAIDRDRAQVRNQVRDNGRMDLNLRERDNSRIVGNTNRQTGSSNRGSNDRGSDNRNVNDRGAVNRSDADRNVRDRGTTNRNTGNGDTSDRRATGNSRSTTDRNTANTGNTDNRAQADSNRARTATNDARSNQNSGNGSNDNNGARRSEDSRPDIRFRERSNVPAASANRTTRPATGNPSTRAAEPKNSQRSSGSSRQNQGRISQSSRSPVSRATPTARATAPTVRQSAPAPRSTAPQRAPSVRQSAPAPRSTAPQRAPSIRQSAPAPRSAAPQRAPAPRAAAPAPQQHAPVVRGNSGSSSRGDSAGARSRPESKPRVRNNN